MLMSDVELLLMLVCYYRCCCCLILLMLMLLLMLLSLFGIAVDVAVAVDAAFVEVAFAVAAFDAADDTAFRHQ